VRLHRLHLVLARTQNKAVPLEGPVQPGLQFLPSVVLAHIGAGGEHHVCMWHRVLPVAGGPHPVELELVLQQVLVRAEGNHLNVQEHLGQRAAVQRPSHRKEQVAGQPLRHERGEHEFHLGDHLTQDHRLWRVAAGPGLGRYHDRQIQSAFSLSQRNYRQHQRQYDERPGLLAAGVRRQSGQSGRCGNSRPSDERTRSL